MIQTRGAEPVLPSKILSNSKAIILAHSALVTLSDGTKHAHSKYRLAVNHRCYSWHKQQFDYHLETFAMPLYEAALFGK